VHGDLEVGCDMGVDIARHDPAGETHHADHAWMQGVVLRECIAADEDEILIARLGGVRVDGREVDLVVLVIVEIAD
jgi:hypothetical protein